MKVFGVNNFGFKFPSILFALLALYATYRLARLFYGEATGRMAALVLASCQGMFLMTNDIRCDTILMAWVVTAVWLIQEWSVQGKPKYILWGFAAIGFGMMTKGPIALMVPGFCFVSDWALKRQWRNFFRPVYLLGLVIIAVLLIPMSIGLYQQFDLHPEKIIDGKHGISGLRFFYWSQSFGRITGESPWKNDVDISFLLQNMLWSFLPWIFLFLPAVIINVVQLVKQKFRLQPQQEWLSTGGFLITYIALGSSSYQLPHYIFVAYPLAAIVTAKLLADIIEGEKYKVFLRIMQPFQVTISFILLVASLILMVYVFPQKPLIIVGWAAFFVGWLFIAFRRSLKGKIFWLTASAMIIVNVFLNNVVYPTLLQYQMSSQVGRFIHKNNIPTNEIASYKVHDALTSVHFYAQGVVRDLDTLTHIQNSKYLIIMDQGLNDLQKNGVAYDLLNQGGSFKVSELTPEFINPKTRIHELKNYYLVRIR